MTIEEIRKRLKELGFSEQRDVIVKGDFLFTPDNATDNLMINYVNVAYNMLKNIVIRRDTMTLNYEMFNEGEEDRPEEFTGEIALKDIFHIDA
jgi:hypothetical protein